MFYNDAKLYIEYYIFIENIQENKQQYRSFDFEKFTKVVQFDNYFDPEENEYFDDAALIHPGSVAAMAIYFRRYSLDWYIANDYFYFANDQAFVDDALTSIKQAINQNPEVEKWFLCHSDRSKKRGYSNKFNKSHRVSKSLINSDYAGDVEYKTDYFKKKIDSYNRAWYYLSCYILDDQNLAASIKIKSSGSANWPVPTSHQPGRYDQ